MKELIIVIGVILGMLIAKMYFGFEVTLYSVLWQGFATLFALAWQIERYKK